MTAPAHAERETERLRRCRLQFERAQRDRVSMEEARWRAALERWGRSERRLSGRLCGTEAPPFIEHEEGGRELAWFQR